MHSIFTGLSENQRLLRELSGRIDKTRQQLRQLEIEVEQLPDEWPVFEVNRTPAIKQPEKVLLGEYTVTAYCPCEKCCGEWARDRPDGIVYGASGEVLESGVSCGVKGIPYGTKLFIDGYGEVIAQDTGADWVFNEYDGKLIDVYFDTHEKALAFTILEGVDVWKIGMVQ